MKLGLKTQIKISAVLQRACYICFAIVLIITIFWMVTNA